ncbi:hypothetical protein WBG78_11055 [Chryseolinea sp. T2]|uniref:hypothetical protein n=1 Tax=Chryseolinea sp. T2 TaxID=3129255 RepID=UPI003077C0E9
MKYTHFLTRLSIGVVFLLVAACQSRNEETQSDVSAAYDTIEALVDTVSQPSGDGIEIVECPRGTPERIVKASIEPQPTFELDKSKNVASETLQFQNGDKLVVTNGGCEYFVVTFRFETNRFKADTADMMYWLDKSAVLVSEVSDAIDAPLDFNDGVAMIKKVNGPEVKYEPGQEIVYSDGEIRQFATLDRVQKLSDSRYAVEVTFALGPI